MGVVDIAPRSDSLSQRTLQTTKEKNTDWSMERDRACRTAETAEQKT